jgi:hypothetical protein
MNLNDLFFCTEEDQKICDNNEQIIKGIRPSVEKIINSTVSWLLNQYINSINSLFYGSTNMQKDLYCNLNVSLSSFILPSIIGFLFYLLIYIVSRILNETRFRALIYREIYELLILLPLAYVFLAIPCISINNQTIYQIGLDYIRSVIASTLISIVPFQMSYSIVATTAVSVVQNLGGGGKTTPIVAMYAENIKSTYLNLANFLSIGYILGATFLFLYDVLTYGFVKYLLPIAILLRFLPITKRLGGGLIGLIIGSAVGIPLVLAFVNFPILKTFGFAYYENGKLNQTGGLSFITDLVAMGVSIGVIVMILDHLRIINWLSKLRNIDKINPKNLIPSSLRSTIVRSMFSGLAGLNRHYFSLLFVQAILTLFNIFVIVFGLLANLLMPTLTFILISTLVRYLSKLYGEEFDLGNLTRLI